MICLIPKGGKISFGMRFFPLDNIYRCFSAKLAKITMIDEISLKEFASGSIDFVKILLVVVQSVNLSYIEGKKEICTILSRL
jgi:hypothetical protein